MGGTPKVPLDQVAVEGENNGWSTGSLGDTRVGCMVTVGKPPEEEGEEGEGSESEEAGPGPS